MKDGESSQRAINGFIFLILSVLGMGIYLIWMLLPEPLLHRIQFTYYPDRYWGVALPAMFVMTILFAWSSYMISYMRNTKPLTSVLVIADPNSRPDGAKTTLGSLANTTRSSVPPIADIPVTVSSRVLHQPW